MTDDVDRVLIVEDDEDIRNAMREVLEDAGYAVDTADDGEAALARMAVGDLPTVVVLDLMMPKMNGYDFRAAQLQNTRIAHVPVVLCTADGHVDAKTRALGVTRGVRKPFSIDELVEAVAAYARPSRP